MFTLLIISIIVAIASGVSVSLSKNLVLSSTARKSQEAFYQADTAGECALFAARYINLNILASSGGSFSCGNLNLEVTSNVSNKYFLFDSIVSDDPCFTIDIDKTTSPVVILARGYNICTGTNVVERGLKLSY